jgi:hypothetical protein
MKQLIIILLAFATCFVACKKSAEIRYKGKYLGANCRGQQVIQVLDPEDKRFEKSAWYEWRPTAFDYVLHANAVSITDSLPAGYNDGEPFYFTITEVRSPEPSILACAVPARVVTLKDLSR